MKVQAVDDYINSFSSEAKKKLKEMRSIIKKSAPKAEECISYGMPAFKLNGKGLAYYAAFKNHIGFFPFPSGVKEFQKLSSDYSTSKGGIQFPFDKPLPVSLIKKVISYRVKENLEKK